MKEGVRPVLTAMYRVNAQNEIYCTLLCVILHIAMKVEITEG